ncbi:hypothetical protein CAPTEDRAFT_144130, partial [Capitella teleta]
ISCYSFNTSLEDWHSARSVCLQNGGHLVALETETEYDNIARMLRTTPEYSSLNNGWWTAGNDIDTEGTWLWADVNRPLTIDRWIPGQPDNRFGTEKCGEFNPTHNYLYNDLTCEWKRPFVQRYSIAWIDRSLKKLGLALSQGS